MSLAEDDDVVETLPADGSDHAFAVRFAVKPSPRPAKVVFDAEA